MAVGSKVASGRRNFTALVAERHGASAFFPPRPLARATNIMEHSKEKQLLSIGLAPKTVENALKNKQLVDLLSSLIEAVGIYSSFHLGRAADPI
jgi:hypothetical protein